MDTNNRHKLVHTADLKVLATIVGKIENKVAQNVEGEDYVPEPRTPLRAADAASKVAAIQTLINSLEYIADSIRPEGYY